MKMKLSTTFLTAILAANILSEASDAFLTPRVPGVMKTSSLSMAATNTIYEGKPTERALNLDIRQEVRKSSFFDVNGNQVKMDELIGEPSSASGVSVVVFLRSLG